MTCDEVARLLLDYLEGELPASQAAAVAAHLAGCSVCAERRRQTSALLADLGAARSAQDSAVDAGPPQPPPVPPAAPAPPRIGDFELLGEIGRGGMGVVHRARQLSLNRIVALKLLSARLVESERSVTRFLREAQAAARLHHTNIVPIYAQGREGDYFYYAMELIEGEALDRILRREREQAEADALSLSARQAAQAPTRRLHGAAQLLRSAASSMRLSGVTRRLRRPRDYKRIARLLAGVAEGLHCAHQQGVIHRDIKPQNLLLGPDDQLHITDFGLARIRDEPTLTRSTEVVGTPAYMAPEQITGRSENIDARTDVYALGVTLYELLTLRRPFHGETYDQTLHQILHRQPLPPRRIDPHIPRDLETICLRALEKEPQRRFPTAADLARDLRRYADDYPITSRRVGPLGKAARWVRRHPARTSAIGAGVLVIILAPLLWVAVSDSGRAQVSAALEVLLEDYREQQRCLARLGWAARLAGDRPRYDLVRAFAHVRTSPQQTVEILERLLRDHPDHADAHYLLAWAYARLTQTRGVELWTDAQRHIRLGDAHEPRASAAGWFFRGQAVWGLDPVEAEQTFDRAIDARDNFTQAILHQCRAMNQIMYTQRDLTYYRKALARLETLIRGQSAKAYPRYLLAITHLLAAEIYQAAGQFQQAASAYADCLDAARAAQAVEPASPRGYAAEAGYWESLGQFQPAIDAWNRLDAPPVQASPSDRAERCEYQMRLHFWLAQYAQAERMRAARYSSAAGYDPDQLYNADEAFYAALIAASAGDPTQAQRALAAGAQHATGRPECLLRLAAAYQALGRVPPPALLPPDVPNDARLSPGWSPAWVATLIRFLRGELDWDAVAAASTLEIQRNDDARLRMAGAWFFRGICELAAGRRDAAVRSLRKACEQYDNENYCFRAKLLLVKLETDPTWPSWLPAGPRP